MKTLIYCSLCVLSVSLFCFWAIGIASDEESVVVQSEDEGFPVSVQSGEHEVVAHFPIPATKIPQPGSQDALFIAQGESGSENLVETFSFSYQSMPNPDDPLAKASEESLLDRFVVHLQLSGDVKIESLSVPEEVSIQNVEGALRLLQVQDRERTDYYAVRVLRVGNDGVVVAVRTLEKSQEQEQSLDSPRLWGFLHAIDVQDLITQN